MVITKCVVLVHMANMMPLNLPPAALTSFSTTSAEIDSSDDSAAER